MTRDDYEILQDLKIIKIILNDIYCKIPIDDFYTHMQMELIEKAVKDMHSFFSGGKDNDED